MPRPRREFPNLSFVTEKHFSSYSLYEINNGNCFNWAFSAYMESADSYHVDLLTLPDTTRHGSHAFIKINGNYFDAEAPKGVMAWRYLPFVRLYEEKRNVRIDNSEVILHRSIFEFVDFWNHPNLGTMGSLERFIKRNYPEFNQILQNRSRELL